MGVAICMKLSCLPCMHVHSCVCVYICVGHLPTTLHPIHSPPNYLPPHPPTPTPQSCRESKSPKFNNEVIDIIRFCLKILYLWTLLKLCRLVGHPRHPHPSAITHLPPPPKSQGNPNQKNYNKSWTNRDNSILFEDLWPLDPPAHI